MGQFRKIRSKIRKVTHLSLQCFSGVIPNLPSTVQVLTGQDPDAHHRALQSMTSHPSQRFSGEVPYLLSQLVTLVMFRGVSYHGQIDGKDTAVTKRGEPVKRSRKVDKIHSFNGKSKF